VISWSALIQVAGLALPPAHAIAPRREGAVPRTAMHPVIGPGKDHFIAHWLA
jgi:hypothetical protein